MQVEVFVHRYEFIDVPELPLPASVFDRYFYMAPCDESAARQALLARGWRGDGDLGLIWLPPFLFNDADTHGVLLWHAKNYDGGTSFIVSDLPLEFYGLFREGGSCLAETVESTTVRQTLPRLVTT